MKLLFLFFQFFLFPPFNPSHTNTLTGWQQYLKTLPIADKPIVDYRGRLVNDQQKHVAIVEFDVGNKDLQQCADALIRLRAEYLFASNQLSEIGFHFTNGIKYDFNSYCKGIIPIETNRGLKLILSKSPSEPNHASLRKYLDIVYAYASTISLEKELKTADDFEIGTVIIHAGSPGHCMIITDEKTGNNGEKLFKLVEGYMPAQSIYVLRNLNVHGISPWYKLSKNNPIETASYLFTRYELKKF